jgi:hypothetical protein
VKNTKRIESNARAGYHDEADPDDTSPSGVMRFEAPGYDNMNNEDFLTKIPIAFIPRSGRKSSISGGELHGSPSPTG